MANWVPRDGDIFITRDNFIFYAFGYEHPRNRVIAFPKYIPQKHRELFQIRFLQKTWKKGSLQFVRAEQLYTAQNYNAFLRAFKKAFPEYVYHCPFRHKDLISVPLKQVKKAHSPNDCLESLLKKKRKEDKLEKLAVRLATLLSRRAKVPLGDFGLHGSLALNMHTNESDVDLVVYGGVNFRRVERAMERLVRRKVLSYVFTKGLDMARRCKGRFRDTKFVFNAVRQFEEIKTNYCVFKYSPVRRIRFYCEVRDDRGTMFRPAVYGVKNYVPIDRESILPANMAPSRVVSMIGYYRNVARRGSGIRVSGMLERIEHLKTRKTSFQVVVGTASSDDEYVWPM